MTEKTQIMLNIVLVLCFAFTVTVVSETHQKIKKLDAMMTEMRERENVYYARRVQVLNVLEEYAKAIKEGDPINKETEFNKTPKGVSYADVY